jgi:hypothetical protein
MKKDGKTLEFHLGHYHELEKSPQERQGHSTRYDRPAGAYIGRSGVNEHKDAELRMILDPLGQIAKHTGSPPEKMLRNV